MKKLLLTDCDGVLLDWTSGFKLFCNLFHPKINIDETSYDLGISQDMGLKIINQFHNHSMFAKLTPLSGSVECLKKLHNELGYKFSVITTCLGSELTVKYRKQNLLEVFGDIFIDVHCLTIGKEKTPVLKQYQPTLYIDDKLKHCVDGLRYGHQTFLMKQTHNTEDNHPGVLPITHWNEIVDYVQNNIF